MKQIQYFIMDVDGTLTDGKIYMGNEGEICKAFNIKDGYGIRNLLKPKGIEPVIITGRTSRIVERRCMELGITMLYQGIEDKQSLLEKILGIDALERTAYIGDDLNDLACMNAIKEHGGIIGCPADAATQVRNLADFISSYTGGNGAVREFIDYLYKKFL